MHRAGLDRRAWKRLRDDYPPRQHERVLIVGVGDSGERARLLALGFGDVLDESSALDEVAARASRVADRAGMLPGNRTIGALRLDLFARDGFVGDRPLALHPREFALLWRLSDTPGVAVSKHALLSEVWHLCHMPETNSLAVHVFRLRAKLRSVGLGDLVQTAQTGGYLLAPPDDRTCAPAIPMLSEDSQAGDLVVADAEKTDDP